MNVEAVGSIRMIIADDKNRYFPIIINNVRYVPNSMSNLLSVDQLIAQDHTVIFSSQSSYIKAMDDDASFPFRRLNGLFLLDYNLDNNQNFAFNTLINPNILHNRLGHPSKDTLVKATGISRNTIDDCKSCSLSKMSRDSFPPSPSCASCDIQQIYNKEMTKRSFNDFLLMLKREI